MVITSWFVFSILILTASMLMEIEPAVAASTVDQIHLSWNANTSTATSTTMTVMWHTASNATVATVEYGTTTNYVSSKTGVTFPSTGPGFLHEATLTGLSPGTTYHYRVSADDGSWSFDRSFVTAPSGLGQFRFLAAGDMGTNDNSRAISRAMADAVTLRGAAFTVGAGDYWYVSVSDESEVDEWFVDNEIHMSLAPFMPSLGNHEVAPEEGNPNRFPTRFSLPSNERYYAFDYGGARFLIIDTNDNFDIGSPQRAFIESELQEASSSQSVRWIIAVFHHPPFVSNTTWDHEHARQELSPLFDQYGVDIVITGHAHYYERTVPVQADETILAPNATSYTDPGAPIYLVTGGGGAQPNPGSSSIKCPNLLKPWSARCLEMFEFLEFQVTPAMIHLTTRGTDGSVLDELRLRTAVDSEPPSQPQNLVATVASSTRIHLTWDASTDNVGVEGYEVYRNDTILDSVGGSTTAYSDTSVTSSTTYTYAVVAFDAAENRSPPSNPYTVSTSIGGNVTVGFNPTDDASIRADSPTANFGSTGTIEVDGSPRRDFLLKFSVTGVGTRRVTNATLRLFATDPSARGGDFYTAGNAWDEDTVTWNTAPSADPGIVASLGPVQRLLWYQVDISSVVVCDTIVSLRVSSVSTNSADYSSKEESNSTRIPQLLVTFLDELLDQPPVLAAIADRTVGETAQLSFSVGATDPEGDRLFYSLGSGAPPGASITRTGTFSWTPTEQQGPGTYPVTVMVSDGCLTDSHTLRITVSEVNLSPVLASIGNQTISETSLLAFTAIATDPDIPVNVLTFSLGPGAPPGASITSSGVFSWTPSEAQGPGDYMVTIRGTDDGSPSLSDEETIAISVGEVNSPPNITVPGPQFVNEETPVTFTVTAQDPDIPTNTVILRCENCEAIGAVFNTGTGQFTWTPTEVQAPGTYIIRFTADDNGNPQLSDTKNVSITVNEVNRQPILDPIGNQTVNEQTFLRFNATAIDPDFPENTLTFSLGPGSPLGASITSSGVFAWSPSEMRGPGTAQVTVIVSDGSLFDSETITITINEVNKPPLVQVPVSQTVDEESMISFNVTASDPDIPAQPLSLSAVSLPAGATFDPVTGEFTWTPAESQGPGEYIATFQVSDGSLTDSQSVSIMVREANRPPELSAVGEKSVDEESMLTFTVTASDADVPAQILTYSLGPDAPLGATIDPATGVFTWTPTEEQGSSVYTFEVRVTDSMGAFDFEMITATVREVNRAPSVVVAPSQIIDEGSPLTFTVRPADLDVPANSFELSASNLPNGASFNPITGLFSWTPTEGQGPGSYPVTFTVTDNGLPSASATAIVTIEVAEVNRNPAITPVDNQTVDEETPLTFPVTASDGDIPVQVLSFSFGAGSPDGASIDPSTGLFSWVPSEVQGPGVYSVTVIVSDGSLDSSETFTVTVREVNEQPTLNPIGDKTVDEQTILTFTVTAFDPDFPDTLTFSLGPGAPTGSSITSGGVFAWSPSEMRGPGTAQVTIIVSDGSLVASETITITINEVNKAPSLNSIGNKSTIEESLLTFSATATDPDIPSNILSFSLGPGSPAGAIIDPSTGVFGWTPSETQGPGVYSITIIVTDNGAPPLFHSQTISVTVGEVNRAPVLIVPGSQTVSEGTRLTFIVIPTDPDVPANTLTLSASGVPGGAVFDPGTGTIVWTPIETQGPGDYTVTFLLSDGALTHLDSVSISVREVNRAPTLTVPDGQTVDEGVLLTFTVSAQDPDVPANDVALTATNLPTGAVFDPSTGRFSWTPDETQGLTDFTISFTATDDGSPPLALTKTVTITIREVNQAPRIDTVGDKTVNEMTPLTFTATATDPDLPAQTLTFTLGSGAPTGASITSTGIFSWVPTESQGPGTFFLTIIVSDGFSTDAQTITLSVFEVNRAPAITVPGPQNVDEGTLLTFTLTASDPDLPAQPLTISAISLPVGANVNSPTGGFSWTPAEDQGPGIYTATFQVSDGSLTDTQAVTVTVREVNRPPILNPIGSKTVDEENPLIFTVTASDPDFPSQTMSFSMTSGLTTANIDPATGAFSWTPSEARGPDTYTITIAVSDGSLSDSETITITVNEVNRPPSITVSASQIVDEETFLTISPAASDPDIPDNLVTLSALDLPPGAAFDPLTHRFTWTPSEAQGPGTYTVRFTATDNGTPTLSTTKTVTIVVNEVNTAPRLTLPGNQTINEGNLLTFTVTTFDTDLPTNVITLSASDLPAGAAFNPQTGALTWTPSESQGPGIYIIRFTATDNGVPSLSSSTSLRITVLEINTLPILQDIGNKTVNEQTLLTFAVRASDVDIPTQTLTFSLDPGVTAASITTDGIFAWSPSEARGPGVYQIAISVSDGLLTDSETVFVTVNEVNSPPELDPIGSKSIVEGTMLTFVASALDSDIPSQNLIYSLGSNAPEGTGITSDGIFAWTPSETQGPGSYPVTIIVSDGSLTDSETIIVSVNESGTFPPVLNPIGDKTVDEGVLLRFEVTASDADIPAPSLTFSALNRPPGANIDPTIGTFTWTPTEVQGPGSYSVTIIVSDGAMTDSELITIMVNEVNRSPSLTAPGSQTVDEGTLVTIAITSTDPDLPANSITLSVSILPQGATFDSTTGRLTWTPSETQGPGSYTVTFSATDDGLPSLSTSKSVTITVNETNQEPSIVSIGDKTVDEETTLSLTVSVIDTDIPGNNQAYSLDSGAPAGSSIGPVTGVFSWKPSESQGPGTYSVTIIVTDDGSPARTDSERITITVREVNRPPALNPIGDKTIDETTLLTFTATASDDDIPTQNLSFSLGSGAPLGASITAVGVFSWRPLEAQGPAIITVTVIVSDGSLAGSLTLTISVKEVNMAPSLTAPSSRSIDEGETLTFAISTADLDYPLNTLTLSASGLPSGATFDHVAGTFSWTPIEVQGPGAYSVRFTVTDNGVPALNSTKTVAITVGEVNGLPRLILPTEQSVNKGDLLAFVVTASDPDIPMQTLRLSSVSLPIGASFNSDTGLFTWRPAEDVDPGSYPATFQVSDGSAADTETLMIRVVEVNNPPVLASIGDQIVDEQRLLTFLASASDPDRPSQQLTFSLASDTSLGAALATDGAFSWSPSEERGPGTYQLTIIVSDGSLTDSETITIRVNEVNRPPDLTVPASQTFNEESPVIFAIAIADLDLDSSGQAFNSITITTTSLPQGASFDPTTRIFSWTPDEIHGPGTYTIGFTATDNGSPALSDTKTVVIIVNEVNVGPRIDPIGDRPVNEQTRLGFTVSASDPDFPTQSLTFSLGPDKPQGATIESSTGVFSWTPSEARGPDSIQLTIIVYDGILTDSQTITITVNEVNTAPLPTKVGPKTVRQGETLTFTVTASDGDTPSQTLSFSLRQPPTGTFPQGAAVTADGVFSWTPTDQESPGTYRIRIVFSDGQAEAFDDVTLTVTGGQGTPLALQMDWIPWFSLGVGVPFALAMVFRYLGKNNKRPA